MPMNPNPHSMPAADVPDRPLATPPKPPPPRRRRWLAWLIALCILAAGAWFLSRQSATSSQTQQAKSKKGGKGGYGGAIPVSAATVEKGNMGVYIEGIGTVTPVYTITVASRVVGTLTEVRYKEGQLVHKGDVLAIIDPRPYEALVVQAQGQLQRDQALLENARVDLARYQEAVQQHAIPEQQVATQQATVHQDEGTVKLDEGNLDAAKVNLDYTRITSPIDGRVGLRTVDPGNIVPANGTTGIATITQLQPITVIFTMAEDYISDVVTQTRAGHNLRVDALNRDSQTELAQGTVLTLDNQIDTSTGTVRVRATFPNRDNKLFPNEFVNAKMLVRTLMGVNIIPMAAIQRNNDVSFVYVVKDETKSAHGGSAAASDGSETKPTHSHKKGAGAPSGAGNGGSGSSDQKGAAQQRGEEKVVELRNVNVATSDGTNAAVTGVAPGEVIVTDGFDKLQDGSKIVVRKPPAGNAPAPPPQLKQQQQNQQTTTQANANLQANQGKQNPPAGTKK
jgi:membrane fusion protein, multidrug efflux system